jgi:hypothetical protein
MDVWRKNEYLRGQTRIYFQCFDQVRNAVTDSTVVEIQRIKKTEQKVTDEMLASVKAGYIGRCYKLKNHKQWQDML